MAIRRERASCDSSSPSAESRRRAWGARRHVLCEPGRYPDAAPVLVELSRLPAVRGIHLGRPRSGARLGPDRRSAGRAGADGIRRRGPRCGRGKPVLHRGLVAVQLTGEAIPHVLPDFIRHGPRVLSTGKVQTPIIGNRDRAARAHARRGGTHPYRRIFIHATGPWPFRVCAHNVQPRRRARLPSNAGSDAASAAGSSWAAHRAACGLMPGPHRPPGRRTSGRRQGRGPDPFGGLTCPGHAAGAGPPLATGRARGPAGRWRRPRRPSGPRRLTTVSTSPRWARPRPRSSRRRAASARR